MLRSVRIALALLLAGAVELFLADAAKPAARAEEPAALRVSPREILLDAPEASEQLLASGSNAAGRPIDVTRAATYAATVEGIVQISPAGRVLALKDGRTDVQVRLGEQVALVAVEVRGFAAAPPISFVRDVRPILSKAGCNSGSCHGKAEGQNGFKLSVFGFDPAADRQAIVLAGRGRRVFPAAPEQSLLLVKATGSMPHGGGQKMAADSAWYRRLRRWIAEGMVVDAEAEDPVVGLSVEPANVELAAHGTQQLRVTTVDQNGRQRCVTAEAEFQSNNEAIAGVDRDGLIAATDVPGEAAILVRYSGRVTVCRIARPRDTGEFVRLPERNFIDRLAWDKLASLRIAPSPPADDATFLRRVFLDTIGTLPTPAEARRFLADPAPDKHRRLVDELLERPEYVDYWTQRWSDLLQIDTDTITPQGAVAMTRWVHGQVERNVPYHQFVRTILTARGSTLDESPAAFFQVQADAEKLARSVSQLFLGVRIECAQCHHHPFERWDQQDYFALAGFFTGVERAATPQGGMKIVGKAGADMKHPRTGKLVPAAGLGARPPDLAAVGDRRTALADWVANRENPYFTRTIANRLWAHYFGRGLVEPIDDMRATNPASNEPLLDALANHLAESNYDLKAFTKTLLDSQLYRLSSEANEENRLDDQNYSHAAWKPIPAEALLDAISQATGVPEEFNGWPRGYRAVQLWDNKLPSHFLEVFGRPARQTACACERGVEPSVAQALHLMNSPTTMHKVEHADGRAAQLAHSSCSTDDLIDELFLATLARFPTAAERQSMQQAFHESSDRRLAAEDILWTLLNTKEFVFNR